MRRKILVLVTTLMFACLFIGCGKGPNTATIELPMEKASDKNWTVTQDNNLFVIGAERAEESLNISLTPKEAGDVIVKCVYGKTGADDDADAVIEYHLTIKKDMSINETGITSQLADNIDSISKVPELKINKN